MADWRGGPAVTIHPPAPRVNARRDLLRYHVAEVLRLLAEAQFIASGPWSRECHDCGAEARRPCLPWCPRFQ